MRTWDKECIRCVREGIQYVTSITNYSFIREVEAGDADEGSCQVLCLLYYALDCLSRKQQEEHLPRDT